MDIKFSSFSVWLVFEEVCRERYFSGFKHYLSLRETENKSTILTRISSLPLYREESSLVDIFILEILVIYLESLSLAHNDDHARGKENLLT